jgi:hypothetical protein
MTALQKISQEAKRIYKANPKLSWTECIKKASLLYSKKKKNAIVKKVKSIPTKAKKVAIKKAKAGAKSIIKKLYDSKVLNGTKAVAKKKPVVKRSKTRSAESEKIRSTVKKDGFIMPHGYGVTKGKKVMNGIDKTLERYKNTMILHDQYKAFIQRLKNNLPGMTSIEKVQAKLLIKKFTNIAKELKTHATQLKKHI